jgi:hypothetical protein
VVSNGVIELVWVTKETDRLGTVAANRPDVPHDAAACQVGPHTSPKAILHQGRKNPRS